MLQDPWKFEIGTPKVEGCGAPAMILGGIAFLGKNQIRIQFAVHSMA